MSVKFGLVGYGVGGRLFHAPYIRAAEDCELLGIVTSSPERAAEAKRDNPNAVIFDSLEAMVSAGVEAVTISTPPHTRRDLVLRAIDAGVHVVADKPFGPTATVGRELAAAADDAGVLLNVFHNRRWDTDIVTALSVRDSGALGQLQRLDLRCDQDSPSLIEAGPTGGLLRDLGSHVVDQALLLLGPARAVTAHLDLVDMPSGRTDAAFTLAIEHASGAHSHLSATKLAGLSSRELRLIGDSGTYVSDYSDVQYDSITTGSRPENNRAWGYEVASRWGMLTTNGERSTVPSAQGDYSRFYAQFARSVTERTNAGPVPASEGIAVLEILDAARESAQRSATVLISNS